MKTDVQVAVIGGGIVGASVLYWITKLGWHDALLLERRELTSGSTWHAAGNTTYFGPYPQMTRLFAGSIRTYLQAEEESGQSVGFQQTGSLRLAVSEAELSLFHAYTSRYEALGLEYHVRSPEEVAGLHPMIDTSGIFGAAHTPTDGHVDPVGATNALAKAARGLGAEVLRQTPARAFTREGDVWRIETDKGPIRAAHVVVAASYWAKNLLAPLGVDLPLYGVEHHELITGSVSELVARDTPLPAMRDSWVSCNIRQERDGFLVGIYEENPNFWALDGIPEDFGEELFPPNYDHFLHNLERLMERVPAFGEAGIKLVNNGPFCATPDMLPLLGPCPELQGLWLATGFNVGIGTGGGAGEFLAKWMIDGTPPFALEAVHADRFGAGMAQEDALDAIRTCYAHGYTLPELR